MNKLASLAMVLYGLFAGLPALAQETNQDTAVDVVAELPSAAELEAAGAIIGRIVFERQNVFDPTKPGENKSIFRLASRVFQ
jgi:hypothetical protein